MSIITAAVIAASLDLPLDPNLGYAALVPYNEKQKDGKYLKKAQFQIMYKGFVQLGIRSNLYERIGTTPIYEGQLKSENPLTGDYEFDFTVKSDKIIGYAAYFRLKTGFEKTLYWNTEKVLKHGKRFSKTFKEDKGRWVDDFDAMAEKTVIKALLSKWGILSIEIQKAIKYDQSTVDEDFQPIYIDNEQEQHEDIRLKPGHKDWDDAVKAIEQGSITVDQLKDRYDLDKENEKILLKLSKRGD
jgi:recombination protein RecT